MVLTLTYVMCCGTVLLLRRRARQTNVTAAGGTTLIWMGLIGAMVMAAVAFISPFWQPGHRPLPLEWQLTIAWSVIGCAVWSLVRKAYLDRAGEFFEEPDVTG
jgi:amino acid transporter